VFFYNPGLVSSWFLVPGVMGIVLTLTSSLVSSTTLVKEKDTGTLEQLLMTPANSWEVLSAKIVPCLCC
jgi:ABC-2 type transport system permease protein